MTMGGGALLGMTEGPWTITAAIAAIIGAVMVIILAFMNLHGSHGTIVVI